MKSIKFITGVLTNLHWIYTASVIFYGIPSSLYVCVVIFVLFDKNLKLNLF